MRRQRFKLFEERYKRGIVTFGLYKIDLARLGPGMTNLDRT